MPFRVKSWPSGPSRLVRVPVRTLMRGYGSAEPSKASLVQTKDKIKKDPPPVVRTTIHTPQM